MRESAQDDALWQARRRRPWNDEAADEQLLDAAADKGGMADLLKRWKQVVEARERRTGKRARVSD